MILNRITIRFQNISLLLIPLALVILLSLAPLLAPISSLITTLVPRHHLFQEQELLAQVSNRTGRQPLTNSTLSNSSFASENDSAVGIKINYPHSWEKIESGNTFLLFVSPPDQKGHQDKFLVKFVVLSSPINDNKLSVSELANEAINNYGRIYPDFFIVDLQPVNFENTPAYRLIYMYNDPVAGNIVVMNIGFIRGLHTYVLSYSAEQTEYRNYVPIVQKMIDSFKVTRTHTFPRFQTYY